MTPSVPGTGSGPPGADGSMLGSVSAALVIHHFVILGSPAPARKRPVRGRFAVRVSLGLNGCQCAVRPAPSSHSVRSLSESHAARIAAAGTGDRAGNSPAGRRHPGSFVVRMQGVNSVGVF